MQRKNSANLANVSAEKLQTFCTFVRRELCWVSSAISDRFRAVHERSEKAAVGNVWMRPLSKTRSSWFVTEDIFGFSSHPIWFEIQMFRSRCEAEYFIYTRVYWNTWICKLDPFPLFPIARYRLEKAVRDDKWFVLCMSGHMSHSVLICAMFTWHDSL